SAAKFLCPARIFQSSTKPVWQRAKPRLPTPAMRLLDRCGKRTQLKPPNVRWRCLYTVWERPPEPLLPPSTMHLSSEHNGDYLFHPIPNLFRVRIAKLFSR